MYSPKKLSIALSLAGLVALGSTPALAAPTGASGALAASSVSSAHSSRAWLRVELGRAKAWLGQAVPITISASFRALDGVTLEGLPQLKSDGIFTTDLARDPRQSTQIIGGEPVLVATWTGTITPSSASPLALSVELPVRIRFHEAAPAPVPAAPDTDPDADPFQGLMGADPFDPNGIQRLFQSMQRSLPMGFGEPLLGRAHDEALTLKASAHPLDVRALPVTDQPANFSGAVGRFDLRASLSAPTARANEPITLTVSVTGDGDLDRVELQGVASSTDWKAYPMSAKSEPSAGKKRAQKIFEQVLIPTHGGALTVPPVELPAFDPIAGRYGSIASAPIELMVEGPAALDAPPQAPLAAPSAPRESAGNSVPRALPPPAPNALLEKPSTVALRLSPILLLLLGAALVRRGRSRDPESALRRTLRRSARTGSVSAFFEAAQRLIVVHFSKRWGVAESGVTVEALRTQLGTRAEPLVQAISTSEALRFGRRNIEPVELDSLRSSIEKSLRNAA
ncbi:MAG TPA: BatD family protein [Polyangiaceae bacterium]|jgi:hypothetical protein